MYNLSDVDKIYKKIQSLIQLVEKGSFDHTTLKEIEDLFMNLVEIIKIFLITKKDSFYGVFFMNLDTKIDFGFKGAAAIKINVSPIQLLLNPLIVGKFSIKEIIFVICHEIEHVILRHHIELKKANPFNEPNTTIRLNYAFDASVNDRIKNESKRFNYKFLKLINDCITSSTFEKIFDLSNVLPNESYVYYYNLIKDKFPIQQNNFVTTASDEISTQENPDKTQSQDSNSNSNQHNAFSVVTIKDVTNLFEHDWGDTNEIDEENVNQYILQSYKQLSSKQKGDHFGLFSEVIEKCSSKKIINWKDLLKKYVGTISSDYRATRTRLNRRQPTRFDISGKISEKVVDIVVALDTSGSMSSETISHIFVEIFAILNTKKFTLTILEFDACVHREYNAKKPNDVKLEVLGRGGTSFECVVKYINNNSKFRKSLLVFFTDGFAEQKITKPNVYRVLWIITGKKECLSVKEPYGAVCELNLEH